MASSNGSITGMLDISRRSLIATQQGLQLISNNIANVNNPEYSRRRIVFQSAQSTINPGAQNVGTGVFVGGIQRIYDTFIAAESIARRGDSGNAQVRQELLSRTESLFRLDGNTNNIGRQVSEFFSAMEDLSISPADFGLRANVLDKGRALAQTINVTANELARLQREADQRVESTINSVNRITSEIATLNTQIRTESAQGDPSLSALDRRDELLRNLSTLVDIKTVDNSDGSILVTIGNGFPLVTVSGSNDLTYTKNPDFGTFPSGLDGGSLGFVVYDYDPDNVGGQIDLTNLLATNRGELGALLKYRGVQSEDDDSIYDARGEVIELASRIESITRDLLIRFNNTYRAGGDAFDLNGNTPDVFGLFTVAGLTDDNADEVADETDLDAMNIVNFSSQLIFAVEDPADFAAGRDLATSGPGDNSNIAALSALRREVFAYSLGNFSSTSTMEEVYQSTVSTAGTLAQNANNALEFATSREDIIEQFRASISGVSLDEELANLVTLQKTYQASARMISLADRLLDEIVSILR